LEQPAFGIYSAKNPFIIRFLFSHLFHLTFLLFSCILKFENKCQLFGIFMPGGNYIFTGGFAAIRDYP
jgi:hypothetical protein